MQRVNWKLHHINISITGHCFRSTSAHTIKSFIRINIKYIMRSKEVFFNFNMEEAIEFVLRRLKYEHIFFFFKLCNSAQSGAFQAPF